MAEEKIKFNTDFVDSSKIYLVSFAEAYVFLRLLTFRKKLNLPLHWK
jgi:hypothetical protein